MLVAKLIFGFSLGQYFFLLSHMLEVYPEMVAQLNGDAFAHVLGTLEFGLHHQVNDCPLININSRLYVHLLVCK